MLNPLNFLSKIIKSSNQKELDKLKKTAKKINDQGYETMPHFPARIIKNKNTK